MGGGDERQFGQLMMENSFLRDMYLAADVGLLTVQLLSAAPDDSVGEGPGGVEGAGHCVNCFGKIRDLFTFVWFGPVLLFPSCWVPTIPLGRATLLIFRSSAAKFVRVY